MGTSARWFGVGSSASPEAEQAGAEATAAALAGRQPALVVVLSEVGKDLLKLAEGVRSQLPGGATIVGVSTSGQFATGTPGAGDVVVAAYGGDGLEVRTSVARNATGRAREAASDAAGCLAGLTLPHRALVLLCDHLPGEQQEAVRGAYSVAGAATTLVGGSAGDGLRYERTYQIVGDATGVEVLSEAVVGVAIGCETPMGVGVAHGWTKLGEPMIVTRSSAGRIYELDGEPAVSVYSRRLGTDPESPGFADVLFHNPLGLSRSDHEDIRVIHSADPEDGSLLCLADVPEDGLVWLMSADGDGLIGGARESCGQALEMLGETPPVGLFTFDCAVRQLILGPDGTAREQAALSASSGNVLFAGWYTNGEIARARGSRGLHHLTFVTLALS